MEKIYLAGAVRTPIGAFLGSLSTLHPKDLGAIVIKESIKRAGLDADVVDEVIMGSVLQGGLGQNVARQSSIAAGLSDKIPAYTVNMVCGSGLRSVIDAARIIAAGEADVIVAGGVESMSFAPYVLPKARTGLRMGDAELKDLMIFDGLTCALGNYHMGITAENVAGQFAVTREQQDAFAFESQKKAAIAMETGIFDEEIVSVSIPQRKGDPVVFSKDEHPKPSTTVESLAKLRPAFKKDGTVTAGNASGINDGASAVVVFSEKAAAKYGITPMVSLSSWAYAGVDPSIMGIGPVESVRKLLSKSGIKLEDIDLVEANEAFASQSIAVGKELGWYGNSMADKVNIHGGAIALGHPIGASGTRILTTLMYEMKRSGLSKGLATLCIGGGMGISVLVEK